MICAFVLVSLWPNRPDIPKQRLLIVLYLAWFASVNVLKTRVHLVQSLI